MNLNITNKSLHFLLPGKVAAVSAMYADDHKCSISTAMRLFYTSSTYKKLEVEETKFWHYGPVALYEIWSKDITFAGLKKQHTK